MANDELINSWAAARMLDCTVYDLFHAQKAGRGPKFELEYGKVRYRRSVLEDFIAKKLPPDAIYSGSVVLSKSSAYAMDDFRWWRRKTTKADAKGLDTSPEPNAKTGMSVIAMSRMTNASNASTTQNFSRCSANKKNANGKENASNRALKYSG